MALCVVINCKLTFVSVFFLFCFFSLTRKATFDMFNFLASQHRPLPEFVAHFDEDDDEFPLKASRLVD